MRGTAVGADDAYASRMQVDEAGGEIGQRHQQQMLDGSGGGLHRGRTDGCRAPWSERARHARRRPRPSAAMSPRSVDPQDGRAPARRRLPAGLGEPRRRHQGGPATRCDDQRDSLVAVEAHYRRQRAAFDLDHRDAQCRGMQDELVERGPPIGHDHLTIKLKGNDESNEIFGSAAADVGTKAIVAIDSGVINLHGTFGKEGFQYLQATAKPNDTQIKVVDASGWAKGDSIVIAPTNFNPYEAEQRSVANISPDGKYITLDTPLKYEHWGSVQQYQNGKGQAWDLDERAEVFNLNRNIRIMAENDESAIKGGHMIVRGSGSAAYVDNVEFYRMGQSGLMGRYPFHWHRKGDVNGQYIKNSSIHKSFQRCVVVHQTNYATVEGNTCFDHFGHGFFLEDGNEDAALMRASYCCMI